MTYTANTSTDTLSFTYGGGITIKGSLREALDATSDTLEIDMSKLDEVSAADLVIQLMHAMGSKPSEGDKNALESIIRILEGQTNAALLLQDAQLARQFAYIMDADIYKYLTSQDEYAAAKGEKEDYEDSSAAAYDTYVLGC